MKKSPAKLSTISPVAADRPILSDASVEHVLRPLMLCARDSVEQWRHPECGHPVRVVFRQHYDRYIWAASHQRVERVSTIEALERVREAAGELRLAIQVLDRGEPYLRKLLYARYPFWRDADPLELSAAVALQVEHAAGLCAAAKKSIYARFPIEKRAPGGHRDDAEREFVVRMASLFYEVTNVIPTATKWDEGPKGAFGEMATRAFEQVAARIPWCKAPSLKFVQGVLKKMPEPPWGQD